MIHFYLKLIIAFVTCPSVHYNIGVARKSLECSLNSKILVSFLVGHKLIFVNREKLNSCL